MTDERCALAGLSPNFINKKFRGRPLALQRAHAFSVDLSSESTEIATAATSLVSTYTHKESKVRKNVLINQEFMLSVQNSLIHLEISFHFFRSHSVCHLRRYCRQGWAGGRWSSPASTQVSSKVSGSLSFESVPQRTPTVTPRRNNTSSWSHC